MACASCESKAMSWGVLPPGAQDAARLHGVSDSKPGGCGCGSRSRVPGVFVPGFTQPPEPTHSAVGAQEGTVPMTTSHFEAQRGFGDPRTRGVPGPTTPGSTGGPGPWAYGDPGTPPPPPPPPGDGGGGGSTPPPPPPKKICGPDMTDSLVDILNTIQPWGVSIVGVPVYVSDGAPVLPMDETGWGGAMSDEGALDLKWQTHKLRKRPGRKCRADCMIHEAYGCITLCGVCVEGSTAGNILLGLKSGDIAHYLNAQQTAAAVTHAIWGQESTAGQFSFLGQAFSWVGGELQYRRGYSSSPDSPGDQCAIKIGGCIAKKFYTYRDVRPRWQQKDMKISRSMLCDCIMEHTGSGLGESHVSLGEAAECELQRCDCLPCTNERARFRNVDYVKGVGVFFNEEAGPTRSRSGYAG